ncbi:MAG: hypothetical protein ACI84C_002353 [Flavobacteriales bacterium]|jgi:hypothetical protein
MRIGFAVVFVFLMIGCKPQVDLQQFTDVITSNHMELMRGEQVIEGKFYTKEEFHVELMFECREKGLAPYNELIELKEELDVIHNKVLKNRGVYYATADSCKKQMESANADKVAELAKIESQAYGSAEVKLTQYNVDFDKVNVRYNELTSEHDIRRITHEEYGNSLLAQIQIWEDSLMMQGSIIGRSLQTLKSSGLANNSDEYRTLYKPVSEMQFLHKKFQSKILSAENQHGRYDSSRQDEWFYVGPYLVVRSDVEMLEADMKGLINLMVMFRQNETTFLQSFD